MIRVAIVGAGPSGFFAAGEVLKRCPGSEVVVFEQRVAPYGLVRYGVAPDHLLTRRATKIFDQIAEQSGFHYAGNIALGRDLSVADLQPAFHAVIFCTGAEIPNRPDLPGIHLPGVVDALSLSRWANGELDAFPSACLRDVDTAVIVGNGNVALDAVRILARSATEWVSTDMAPTALEALMHHRIKHLIIAGRRGSAETSFTEAELNEVVSLPGWDIVSSQPLPFGLSPQKPASARRLEFLFHRTVQKLEGSSRVERVVGQDFSIPAQLVIFATGHRGAAIEDVPFDDRDGVIPNDRGRISSMEGCYVCGWIKRGAKGLIGMNRKDAMETIARVVEDLPQLTERTLHPWKLSSTSRPVSWAEWKKLDAIEVQHGAALGRPRLRLTNAEALAALE